SIHQFLLNKCTEFNLEGKIVCAVTDNGTNIIKAMQLWNVVRLPYAAHTLQLTVNFALQKIHPQTKKIKKLVNFFSSSKQQERLEKAQMMVMEQDCLSLSSSIDIEVYFEEEEAGKIDDGDSIEFEEQLSENIITKPLHPIKDCPTRWNSKYQSWKRLLKLKDAIIWLEANLNISRNLDDKKDEKKL
ncbi:22781_t:CDS:1, partial [Cetraspora pellucida]